MKHKISLISLELRYCQRTGNYLDCSCTYEKKTRQKKLKLNSKKLLENSVKILTNFCSGIDVLFLTKFGMNSIHERFES